MEENRDQSQVISAMSEEKPKQSKGMLIGMMAGIVLGFGGIGFGIYELSLTNQAKQEISDLKDEVKNSGEKAVIAADNNAMNVDTTEYIYLGKWGIKIKIPDNLKKISYSIVDSENGYTSLKITGRKNDDYTEPAFNDDFSDFYLNRSGNGTIGIYSDPATCQSGAGALIECTMIVNNSEGKEIGIVYYHPQAVFSISEEQMALENEITDIFKTMPSTPENYSAI